jgi:hypothetical protein
LGWAFGRAPTTSSTGATTTTTSGAMTTSQTLSTSSNVNVSVQPINSSNLIVDDDDDIEPATATPLVSTHSLGSTPSTTTTTKDPSMSSSSSSSIGVSGSSHQLPVVVSAPSRTTTPVTATAATVRGYSYTDFASKMKQPAASDIVKQLKAFVKKINSRNDAPRPSEYKEIHEFINQLYVTIRKHPLWKEASPPEMDNVLESLEKFVMSKLYDRLLASTPVAQEIDHQLANKMAALSFLTPTHFEIPSIYWDNGVWSLAQNELRNMDAFKSPRDKIVCLLNCCRIIMNQLKKVKNRPSGNSSSNDTNSNGSNSSNSIKPTSNDQPSSGNFIGNVPVTESSIEVSSSALLPSLSNDTSFAADEPSSISNTALLPSSPLPSSDSLPTSDTQSLSSVATNPSSNEAATSTTIPIIVVTPPVGTVSVAAGSPSLDSSLLSSLPAPTFDPFGESASWDPFSNSAISSSSISSTSTSSSSSSSSFSSSSLVSSSSSSTTTASTLSPSTSSSSITLSSSSNDIPSSSSSSRRNSMSAPSTPAHNPALPLTPTTPGTPAAVPIVTSPTPVSSTPSRERVEHRPSADDFLPILIYCVLHARPRHLHLNIEYIANARHPTKLTGIEPLFHSYVCMHVCLYGCLYGNVK